MTIYDELLSRVEKGENFHIDFKKRNMRVGKDWLVKDGTWDKNRELIENTPSASCPFDLIENYYNNYKTSVPNKKNSDNRNHYFKALSVDELTDKQMVMGENRSLAQARLEGFILISILNGWRWHDDYGKWFWQSSKDKDLIILKEWVEQS